VVSTRKAKRDPTGQSLSAAIDAFVDTLDNPGTARNYGGTALEEHRNEKSR
jgi:hypothetical protein